MNEKEVYERLTTLEQRSKNNTYQIADLKLVVHEIHTISKTLVTLTERLESTKCSVDELKVKIETVEKEPGLRIAQIKAAIITSITSAIVSGIISTIFMFR